MDVTIKGQSYLVEPNGDAAFRLHKYAGEGEVYDVARTDDGLVTCDCAHYTYRLAGNTASMCKHGAALVEKGLLAPPSPVVRGEAPGRGRKPYTAAEASEWMRQGDGGWAEGELSPSERELALDTLDEYEYHYQYLEQPGDDAPKAPADWDSPWMWHQA